MHAVLISALVWFLGNAVARVLLGAGLAIVSVTWVESTLNDLLSSAANVFVSGSGIIVAVCGNGGIWIALSNIGSALLMRAAIIGAANVMGLRKK